MKKKNSEKEHPETISDPELEEIRQRIKKQELQTIVLKKILEKSKNPDKTDN